MANLRANITRKTVHDLGQKLRDGTITAQERRILDKAAADLEAIEAEGEPEPSAAVRWPASTPDLCDLFSVTAMTITNWVKQGMPKLGRGRFDAKAVFAWWQENINAGPEDRDQTIVATKQRYWEAKADNEGLKRDQTKGRLISREEVVREWAWRAGEFRAGLRSWSSRLPMLLEGKDVHQIRETLRDEGDKLLDAYARDGRYTPARKAGKARRKK